MIQKELDDTLIEKQKLEDEIAGLKDERGDLPYKITERKGIVHLL